MATWIDKIVAQTKVGKAYIERKAIAEAQAKRDKEIEELDDRIAMEEVWSQALEIWIRDGQT